MILEADEGLINMNTSTTNNTQLISTANSLQNDILSLRANYAQQMFVLHVLATEPKTIYRIISSLKVCMVKKYILNFVVTPRNFILIISRSFRSGRL